MLGTADFEGGLVAEASWLEDYKVGIGADLHASLLAGFGRAAFHARRGHDGVHQGEGAA
jgi:hypothetical protein